MSEIFAVQYGGFGGRFPIQPAKGKCRGCHQDVPKGRKTWCSDKCYQQFEPSRVRWHCLQRDKGVCSMCGVDSERIFRRFAKAKWVMRGGEVDRFRYYRDNRFDQARYDAAFEIARRHEKRRRVAAEKRMATTMAFGWPKKYWRRDWWEMDHVIPFSEGGITILENVRTLCYLCHKKRTKQWHSERKKGGK
jgi:hypothetical protein